MSLAAEFFISNNSGKHYRSWSAVFAPEVVLSFSPVPRRHAQSLREKFISLISELMFSDLNTSLRHLIEPSKQPYQGSALPRKKGIIRNLIFLKFLQNRNIFFNLNIFAFANVSRIPLCKKEGTVYTMYPSDDFCRINQTYTQWGRGCGSSSDGSHTRPRRH